MKLKLLSEDNNRFVLDDKILSLDWDYAVPFTTRIPLSAFDAALKDPNLIDNRNTGQPMKLQYWISKNYLSIVLDSEELLKLDANNSSTTARTATATFHDEDEFVEPGLAIVTIENDSYNIEQGIISTLKIIIRPSTVAKLQQVLQQCNIRFTEYMKKMGHIS